MLCGTEKTLTPKKVMDKKFTDSQKNPCVN